MNRWEEVATDIFPIPNDLLEDSNTLQRQPSCCSLGVEAPDNSEDSHIPCFPCLPAEPELMSCLANSSRNSFDRASAGNQSMSSTDSAADQSTATDRHETAKFDGFSNEAHTQSMDERDIWLKISNSSAATAGSRLRFPLRIRSSSAIVAIRRLSAAKHAARPRRTSNRAEVVAAADTSAARHRIQA
jgi:hypothetical protein